MLNQTVFSVWSGGIRCATFSPLAVAPWGIFTTANQCAQLATEEWEMAPVTINWNHDGQRRLSLSRVRLPTLQLLLPVLVVSWVSLLYRMPLLLGLLYITKIAFNPWLIFRVGSTRFRKVCYFSKTSISVRINIYTCNRFLSGFQLPLNDGNYFYLKGGNGNCAVFNSLTPIENSALTKKY